MRESLSKFIEAQEADYETALAEIKNGRKRSHWMWYMFPQLAGLGESDMSRRFAIGNLEEAGDYLNHPLLGRRLVQMSRALLELKEDNATSVMGSPDDRKLWSSMTLFSLVPGADPVFEKVLKQFFGGEKDASTLRLATRDIDTQD